MNKQYIRILAEVAIVLSAAGMMTGCVNKTAKDVNSSKAEIVITTDAETTADEIIADSSSNFESSSSLNESSLSDNSANSSIADSKVDSKVESTTTTTVGNVENPQNYVEVYEPIYNVTTAPQIEPVLDEETPELGEPVVDTTPVLDEETPTEVLAPESTADSNVDYSGAAYTPNDLYYNGRINYGNYQYTWYSERVLPGYGLAIEGRHTDADGFVCDGDGYICVAASSLSKGTIVDTPFGRQGKVYDSGCAWNVIDCYVNW